MNGYSIPHINLMHSVFTVYPGGCTVGYTLYSITLTFLFSNCLKCQKLKQTWGKKKLQIFARDKENIPICWIWCKDRNDVLAKTVVLFQVVQKGTTFTLVWEVAKCWRDTPRTQQNSISFWLGRHSGCERKSKQNTHGLCAAKDVRVSDKKRLKLVNIYYFVTSEEALFTMFPNLVDLHLKNGLNIGNSLSHLCPCHTSIYEALPGGETKKNHTTSLSCWFKCVSHRERPGGGPHDRSGRW